MSTEHPSYWLGACPDCGNEFEIAEDDLRATYPEYRTTFDEGAFYAACPSCEHGIVALKRTEITLVRFKNWQMFPPPADGCPECAIEHPSAQPHNLSSLTYQYSFRLKEAKAGREERWPTWRDAMAHCTQEVQASWTAALKQRGIEVP